MNTVRSMGLVRFTLLIIGFIVAAPAAAHADSVSLTQQLRVVLAQANLKRGTSTVCVKLKNKTTGPVFGPVRAELILPARLQGMIMATNADGVTEAGNPFYDIYVGANGVAARATTKARCFTFQSQIRPPRNAFKFSLSTPARVVTAASNPADPMLTSHWTDEGALVTFYGAKDDTGNPTQLWGASIVDPDGNTSRLTFDGDGRLEVFAAPNGAVLRFQWIADTQGLLSVTTADGGHKTIHFDLAPSASTAARHNANSPIGGDPGDNAPQGAYREASPRPPVSQDIDPLTTRVNVQVSDGGDQCPVNDAVVELIANDPAGKQIYSGLVPHLGGGLYSVVVPRGANPAFNLDKFCSDLEKLLTNDLGKLACDSANQALKSQVCLLLVELGPGGPAACEVLAATITYMCKVGGRFTCGLIQSVLDRFVNGSTHLIVSVRALGQARTQVHERDMAAGDSVADFTFDAGSNCMSLQGTWSGTWQQTTGADCNASGGWGFTLTDLRGSITGTWNYNGQASLAIAGTRSGKYFTLHITTNGISGIISGRLSEGHFTVTYTSPVCGGVGGATKQ